MTMFKWSLICFVLCCGLNALITVAQSCAPSVCKNGGTVTVDASYNLACSCPFGYTGKLCEQTQCLNGGTPLNVDGNLECSCPAGFFGFYCDTSCPSNFILLTSGPATINNKVGCFHFVMTQRTWADSQVYCKSLDVRATLTVVDDPSKNDAIKQYLNGLDSNAKAPCVNPILGTNWITALQRVTPGDCSQKTFVWRPIGLPETEATYSDWGSSQPDCTGHAGLQNESCGGYWDTINYQWNDVSCDGSACAICEVPAQ